MIKIDNNHLKTIKEILNKLMPNSEFRIFGSRVTGKPNKYSDIDIAILNDTQISENKMQELRDMFSESDLPILVDLVDFKTISPEFRKIINQHYEVL